MIFLVFVVCFSLFSFIPVSAPKESKQVINPQDPTSQITLSKTELLAMTRFIEQEKREMRKEIEEIINRLANAELVHHYNYMRLFEQARDLLEYENSRTLTRYWASVTRIYIKEKLRPSNSPSDLIRDIKNEKERLEHNYKAPKYISAETAQQEWIAEIYQSAKITLEYVEEFKIKYGIPESLNPMIRSFLEDCSVPKIAQDLINGIMERLEIEFERPNLQKSMELFEILKNEIQYYNTNDIDVEPDVFKRFWIGMINVMKKRIENPFYMDDDIFKLYCGGALYQREQQTVCRKYRIHYDYLTLKQMEHLVELIRK